MHRIRESPGSRSVMVGRSDWLKDPPADLWFRTMIWSVVGGCHRVPRRAFSETIFRRRKGAFRRPRSRCKLVAALAMAAVSLAAPRALAADYVYQFNNAFSGSAPVSTNRPWIDAIFQTVTPGTVRLTVTNLTLSASENVDQVYFNLNTALKPANLTFTLVNESGLFKVPKISTGVNKFQADGDGKYDILFNFNSGGTANTRFTAGESVTYYISGIPNLVAADFSYLSAPAGGAGPFYAAAHVQRIGNGTLSGWLSASAMTPLLVPEPTTIALSLLASGVWLVRRASRRSGKH